MARRQTTRKVEQDAVRVDADPVALATINADDLEREVIQFPAEYAYIMAKLPEMESDLDRRKAELDELRARRYSEIREELEARGKVTEKMLEGELLQDPTLRKARLEFLELEAEVHRCKFVQDVLRRKEAALRMLVQLRTAEQFTTGVPDAGARLYRK